MSLAIERDRDRLEHTFTATWIRRRVRVQVTTLRVNVTNRHGRSNRDVYSI